MPLHIIRQDITKMECDAIVNAANSTLLGGGGVDGAIHQAAGRELLEECKTLGGCQTGDAKITKGYRLPCKYVIHTVGPIWQGGEAGESDILRSCYVEALKLAVKNGCQSVAFPLISAGTYGFPKDQVLKFAIQTITEFLFEHELTVYLCVFDRDSYSFSQKLFNDIRSFIDDDYDACDREISACYLADEPNQLRHANLRTIDARRTLADRAKKRSLQDYVRDMDKSFQEKLFDLIDKSGMTDVECYKRANVDKRTFSKIKSNKDYKPSKQTAIAFAIALHLDLSGTQELLATVGFTLSRSNVFDKIIQYFIQNGNYKRRFGLL